MTNTTTLYLSFRKCRSLPFHDSWITEGATSQKVLQGEPDLSHHQHNDSVTFRLQVHVYSQNWSCSAAEILLNFKALKALRKCNSDLSSHLGNSKTAITKQKSCVLRLQNKHSITLHDNQLLCVRHQTTSMETARTTWDFTQGPKQKLFATVNIALTSH